MFLSICKSAENNFVFWQFRSINPFEIKKHGPTEQLFAALLAREALPYFQSGALQRAAALAIFRGLCRYVNEYARANPSKLS
jgi:hypothetical protein